MQTRTGSAAKLLAFAELALSPSSYPDPAGSLTIITDILAQRQWIETLVIALEKLVALSVSSVGGYEMMNMVKADGLW